MAGKRKGTGKFAHPAERIRRNLDALEQAATVERQVAIAFDWCRVALRGNAAALGQLAEYLANTAHAYDRKAAP